MIRVLLFIVFVFVANNFQAQKKDNPKSYKIESCTDNIGIANKDGLSALWDYKKGSLINALDSSFYQFYTNTKCLIKVTKNDSIFCYDLRKNSPKLLFSAYKRLRVDVLNEFSINYNGKGYKLGTDEDVVLNGRILGEFGIDALEETIIVIDYQERGDEAEDPLKDDKGNNIVFFDSISELKYVKYEKGKIGYSKGGVRDRLTKEWIIEPSANWIVKGFDTYVTEKTIFLTEDIDDRDTNVYTIYDFDGKIIKNDLSEFQLVNTPQYFKLLAPNYKCDSIYPIFKSTSLSVSIPFPRDYYFISDGKIGCFKITTNDIIYKPVDFLLWKAEMDYLDIYTIIENDSITFLIADRIVKYRISEGNKFEFYGAINYNTAAITLRIKKEDQDSLFTFCYRFSDIMDSVIRQSFIGSNLEMYLINNEYPKLHISYEYSIERIKNDYIIVTNNKLKRFDDEKEAERWADILSEEDQIEELFSGVYDLKNHNWIILPKYRSIIEVKNGFKAFKEKPKKENAQFDLFDIKGNLISQ